MNVHHYCTRGGKDLILEYIDSLPLNEKAAGLNILYKLEKDGRLALDILNTRLIKEKLREIKFGRNRIMYVLVDNDNIYLLHAFKKQKNKTEKFEKETALKRAKQI